MVDTGCIVDVRTVEEFQAGHVPGSLNIPMDEVVDRIEELRALPRPMRLVCKSGGRSGHVVAYLQANKFEDVMNCGAWESLL
jgi:rhodanese-related sulfurtransferase